MTGIHSPADRRRDFCIAMRLRLTLDTTLDQHRPYQGWSLTFFTRDQIDTLERRFLT